MPRLVEQVLLVSDRDEQRDLHLWLFRSENQDPSALLQRDQEHRRRRDRPLLHWCGVVAAQGVQEGEVKLLDFL